MEDKRRPVHPWQPPMPPTVDQPLSEPPEQSIEPEVDESDDDVVPDGRFEPL